MTELNLGKLKREAIEARYGKVQMDPRDLIVLIERCEKAELALARMEDTKTNESR